MNAYEVTFRVWAETESEAREDIASDPDRGEIIHSQISDDQDPPGAWLEGKVQT